MGRQLTGRWKFRSGGAQAIHEAGHQADRVSTKVNAGPQTPKKHS